MEAVTDTDLLTMKEANRMERTPYGKVIRLAGETMRADAYELWGLCFGDSKAYMDNYFSWRMKESTLYGIYAGATLASMVHLNPYPFLLKGKLINTNYIVGVATREEHRKQGLMRRLLIHSLQDMYTKGHPFTYLMPAKESIYLPFDFRYVYAKEKFTKECNADITEGEELPLRRDWEVRDLTKEAILEEAEFLRATSDLLMEKMEGYAYRDVHYYHRLLDDMVSAGGGILTFYHNGTYAGYASYMLEGDQSEVSEMIILSEYSQQIVRLMVDNLQKRWITREGLQKNVDIFTKELEIHARKLKISILESAFLDKEEVRNLGFEAEILPAIMARIVNLSVMAKYIYASEPVQFVFCVRDSLLSDNTGNYLLSFREQTAQGYTCIMESVDSDPDVVVDIATLTQLVFGAVTMEEVVTSNGKAREAWSKVRVLQDLYINEIV